MLSVAKLTVGQEAYYEQQVATGLDDYFAGRGESPGIWAGRGAAELALAGFVGDGDLGTLLRGVNPTTGTTLRAPVRERMITVRTLDRESGAWREETKRLAPVSGYDLVFSCPKSVSLLHALTEDEGVRREISEAHEAAWQAALRYLEREACVVRRGHGGALRERGAGFLAAAFRHRTSRAQDPHLHTHVIVANMARTADGEWRALDGEALLRTYRLAAGYLYEAQLRHELRERLRLRWREPVKGMGELEGVQEDALRAFSTRRHSLVEHMEALGSEGFAAARVAALATRKAKEQVALPRLREEWKARAAKHGLGRRELDQLVGPPQPAVGLDLDDLALRLFGPDGLTEKQTTFTLPELVCAVAGALHDGATVNAILQAANELARFPAVELLDPEVSPGRPARFTTRELLAIEREALAVALQGRDAAAPQAPVGLSPTLSPEQRAVVREACLRPDRVVCVVGVAGAGKTSALRSLADAYRGTGVPVLGAAPSGRAAEELGAATGIASATLHRLLLDACRGGGLPHGAVLVVDEAGMAETRVLAPLLRMVDEAGGKTILVGDPAQLPAVGAGGLFPALCERLGAIALAENRRQRNLSERSALALLRAGDAEAYLAHAAQDERLHLERDPVEAKRRLLEDWWQVARYDLAGSVMLAYRRSDVRELNEAARTLLMRAGRLEPNVLDLDGRDFRVGDRVLCRRNDRSLGVRNGTRGTVIDLGPSALAVRTDAGALHSLPLRYAAEHLDHAYALTGHAAQGATVERAFVLFPGQAALREWGYVASSRARGETHVYLAERDTIERETPLRDPNPTTPAERAASALERSSLKPLALDQTRDHRDATMRLLAQEQERLDRVRERTATRLVAAQRELGSLHWWNRSGRADLEAQIARDRATLERTNEKREQLGELAARRSRTLALARERAALAPSAGPEQARLLPKREPSGLGLEL